VGVVVRYILFSCSFAYYIVCPQAAFAFDWKGFFHQGYAEIPSQGGLEELVTVKENFYDLDSIIEAKCKVLAQQLDDAQKTKKIGSLYKSARPFLKTTEDYINLLKVPTGSATDYGNEQFLLFHLDEIFAHDITLEQLKSIGQYSDEIATVIRIKTHGLSLVKTPDEYLELVHLNVDSKATDNYKQTLTDFIRLNLRPFKASKPTIEKILELQAHVLNLKTDKTVYAENALLKIKYEWCQELSGNDLKSLLQFGSNQLSKNYQNQLEELQLYLDVKSL
jgi:hypothetical protein